MIFYALVASSGGKSKLCTSSSTSSSVKHMQEKLYNRKQRLALRGVQATKDNPFRVWAWVDRTEFIGYLCFRLPEEDEEKRRVVGRSNLYS